MKNKEIVKALRSMKVQTGSLACLGCGYEHHCGRDGCAIMRMAANALENQAIENQSLRNAARGFQNRMKAAEAREKELLEELTEERYRYDRLQDFEVEEAKQLEALKAGVPGWINAKERLPENSDWVLALVSGNPTRGVHFNNGYALACYGYRRDGWTLQEFPEWDGARVSYWMPLPDAPEDVRV